jgi:hypothetical protein
LRKKQCISEIIRIGSLTTRNKLVVVIYFVDLAKPRQARLVLNVGKELLDVRQLGNRHLVVKLLVVWVVVNVVGTGRWVEPIRNCNSGSVLRFAVRPKLRKLPA